MQDNNIIITGMPRSGTSYLCSILNKVKDTVVINEPGEVLQILRNDSEITLSQYYEHIRSRVLSGLPIVNKIIDGKFVEDTAKQDVRSQYVPKVSGRHFMLGTKNTLIYLNTIERLLNEFPDSTFIACVRDPVDAISSWSKVSFAHIRNADPGYLIHYADPHRQQEINNILGFRSVEERSAAWWNLMAGIILRNKERMIILRYEDMVSDPTFVLKKICEAAAHPYALNDKPEKSSPRTHENLLGGAALNSIRQYCSDSANQLGYSVE